MRSSDTSSGATAVVGFDETSWDLIARAGLKDGAEAVSAREEVCRSYWYPVYSFVRRLGHPPHVAEDLTQEVFVRLVEKNSFAVADPRKGRFRSFLIGLIKNVVADHGDKERAAKRGGGVRPDSLDTLEMETRYGREAVDDVSPERLLDRGWATVLLEQALRRLEEEFAAVGDSDVFVVLRTYLTNDVAEGDYDRLASRLGLRRGSVPVVVHRFRRRYCVLVRQAVARTVATVDELETELRWLFGQPDGA